MAGIKISELPEASSICGNELVAIVQNSCTKFVSASAIGSTGGDNITDITAACGLVGGGNAGSVNISMDTNCYNKYNNTTITLAAASANWESTYSTLEGLSGNWDQSGCTGLNCVGDITGLCVGSGITGGGTSGDVSVCIDAVCSTAWNGTTSVVAANSASWIGGTGDITGVTAGTLLSGGATSGDATLGIDSGALDYLNQSACAGLNCIGDITGLCVGDGITGGGGTGTIYVCLDPVCTTAWNGTTSVVAANSATWAGGTTISGSANRIAKFDSTGNNIDDSVITDNSTNVTINADSIVCGNLNARSVHLPTLSSTCTDPGVAGYVYQDGRDLKISSDIVTVCDTAGTASTLASSCLYSGISHVTVGPASGADVGSYYKTSMASDDELTVAFYSDADEIEVKIERSNSLIQTFIDDMPVHEFASGGYQNRLLKLSHDDKKIRKYELRGKSYGYGGVYVNGTNEHAIWPYKTRRERPLLAIMTDSYGTGFNDIFGRSFAEKLAEFLDMDLFSDSINSTGWSTATVTTTTRADTLNALSRAPDVILACLGFNDKSSPNQTNIEAGIDDWHAAVIAKYPTAAIMLASPWTPQGAEANLTTVSGYIAGRATALGADFININGVVTADNEYMYTSDDSTHPNQAGHELLARRLEAGMLATGNVPASD